MGNPIDQLNLRMGRTFLKAKQGDDPVDIDS